MSWFQYVKSTNSGVVISTSDLSLRISTITNDPATLQYAAPPLRRRVLIDDLEEDIEAGEVVYVDLGTKSVNKYYNETLGVETTQDSYIVVYEDSESDVAGTVVRSKAIDSATSGNSLVYFQAAEKHAKNTKSSMSYSIYYGTDYLKYLQQFITLDDKIVYKMVDNPEDVIYAQGAFFDLDVASFSSYTYSATSSSTKSYQLALYNNGTDWEDNYSLTSGAKAFGIFDGPGFSVHGELGPSSGKFRIRILSLYDDNSISKNVILDWTEVDCYNSTLLESEILYENSNLEYKKYIFEIETLTDKNIMSQSNSVKIEKYMFSPNYKLIYEKEEFNPDLSFITVGGIR
jgi:hypothetical protein